jgi:hypothetical protein
MADRNLAGGEGGAGRSPQRLDGAREAAIVRLTRSGRGKGRSAGYSGGTGEEIA